jgi:hypothetical protein
VTVARGVPGVVLAAIAAAWLAALAAQATGAAALVHHDTLAAAVWLALPLFLVA